jgi:hypothetical protein
VNVNLLIDNIVRQTTVLVAQLATAAGGRAPLAHVAGQVFFELVKELKLQGLGNKVIADMFGLTLRTYHDRVRRTSESRTDRGSSLWEAVLHFVHDRGLASRADLLRRFRADDEATVRGVLSDLVESGLLFKSGRMDSTSYRAASSDETQAMLGSQPERRVPSLLWVHLHQRGAASPLDVAQELGLSEAIVLDGFTQLLREQRVVLLEDGRFRADQCVIPYGDELGWEAAVFDHFQAMVTAIGHKVSSGKRRAEFSEAVGGSTYHFDVFPGHPEERTVLEFLSHVREQASELRRKTMLTEASPTEAKYRVVFYAGQNVSMAEEKNDPAEDAEDA